MWNEEARLVKINLEDFSIADQVRLSSSRGTGLVLDNGYGYVVCRTSPGTVIKVDLETMTEVDKLTYIDDWNEPQSGVVTIDGNIYSLCKLGLIKINMDEFKVMAYFTVVTGDGQDGIVADNGVIYICR